MRYMGSTRVPSVIDTTGPGAPKPWNTGPKLKSAAIVGGGAFDASSLTAARKIVGQAAPTKAVEVAQRAASELIRGEANLTTAAELAREVSKSKGTVDFVAPPRAPGAFGNAESPSSNVPIPAGQPVIAAETPSGAPVILQSPDVDQVHDGVSYFPATPINDRAPNGPPNPAGSYDGGSVGVTVTADDWMFVAGGVAIAAGVAALVLLRKRKRR